MEFLDLILAIGLLYGFGRGIWNGFLVELASTASLIIGVFIAIKFSDVAARLITSLFEWDLATIRVVAFVLTFVAVVVGVAILAKVLTKVFAVAGLGLINKLLGAVFGLLKMAFVLSVVLNIFFKVNSASKIIAAETLDNSILYKPVLSVAPLFFPVLNNFSQEILAPKDAT